MRQWNKVVDLLDELEIAVLDEHKEISEQITDFENFGIGDALEAIE